MGKRSFNSGAMRVLKPGEYCLIIPGKDKPGKGFPSKCLHCLKPIKDGDTWRSRDNGQIVTIMHTACEVESKKQSGF